MTTNSRRIFLKVAGATALAPRMAEAAVAAPPAASAAAPVGYRFFTPAEAAWVEAAVQRLIPPDELGPGALEAGVPTYIDLQLAGAWGAGERLYRSGPWHPGTPQQGYQLPFTPAELFRNALRGVAKDLQQAGRPSFDKLSGDEQDAYLTKLQTGTQDLEGVPANVFFESLLGMATEGYFCDPVYGGNKGMAAWRMIGFPGAYATFYELVDQHGLHFTAPPRSMAEDRGGHIHLMPDISAAVPGALEGHPAKHTAGR